MHFTDRLSMAQRIVLVVALGLAFGAIGSYLDSFGDMGVTGWTGYAPLQVPNTGLANWLRLLIWLVLIGVWAVAAIRVLRPAPAEPAAASQP